MDPEQLFEKISDEMNSALQAMAEAATVEEKLQYSEIVKNLSKSLGVFLEAAMGDITPFDFDDEL